MDGFVLEKDESSLELAMLVQVKAKDAFLTIRKKIGPILNLQVGRQSAVLA